VFQISDTGKGISLKDIPLALAPFGQVPEPAHRFQGTGLGLPLSKALIELHAGSLDLQSELGIGTTVTIRLPAERVRTMPKVA
jgi:signal transduction histidine kinase